MSVLAGFSLPTTLIAQSAPRQPNVVIIVADDLGYGDLSCYGAHRIQTPGMDRIANEGIRFTQGYCTAATSTPSRYSVMTAGIPCLPDYILGQIGKPKYFPAMRL